MTFTFAVVPRAFMIPAPDAMPHNRVGCASIKPRAPLGPDHPGSWGRRWLASHSSDPRNTTGSTNQTQGRVHSALLDRRVSSTLPPARVVVIAYNITRAQRSTIHHNRPWLLAALAYALGAVIFLWPMPANINSAIWGDRFDAWTTLWLIDHLGERIVNLDFGAETTEILFPIGYNLWSFGHMALQGIGGMLVAIGLPLVATYNLLLLLGIWSSAIAAHALGKTLTGSHLAGGLAGVVFASTPYLYAEAGTGCIELVAAGLLPLHAMTLIQLLRDPSLKRMGWATACLAIIGPFNWYYTLFAGLAALGILAIHAVGLWRLGLRSPTQSTRRHGLKLALLSLLLAAIIDAPMIALARQETPARPDISADLFSSDEGFQAVRSVTNSAAPIDTLDKAQLQQVDALQVHFNSTSVRSLLEGRFEANPLYSTPGRLAFAAGIFGLFVAGRRTWGWASIGAGATVLTLGPYLNISGALMLPESAHDWPLPYYWAHEYLPFFSKAYRPYRIGVVTSMCLAAMASIGVAAWIRSARLPSFKWPLLVFGTVAFSQPHWASTAPANRPLASTAVDSAYHQLAELEEGGVIELPLLYQPVSKANALTQFHQTVHGHPILNSNQLIRWPDLLRFRDHVGTNGGLSLFVDLARRDLPLTVEESDITALRAQGYRWIVARRQVEADSVELAADMVGADLLGAPAWALLDGLFGVPVIDSGATVIWDMAASGGGHTVGPDDIQSLDLLFDPVSTGFPLVLREGQRLSIFEGEASAFQGWLLSINPDAAVSLLIEDDGIAREVPLELIEGHWRYSNLQLDAQGEVRLSLVGRSEHASQIHITLASVTP